MAVTVREELVAAGSWSVDIDYTPVIHAELVDDRKRPRKLTALFYNAENILICPPMVLLKVRGDEESLTIGGLDALWYLGSSGVGPTIVEREYLSGTNKLSNPVFALDPPDLYWVFGDTAWVIGDGFAATFSETELYEDQVLASDEKFEITVAGAGYESTVTIGRIAGYGVGRLRLRHVYTGGPFTYPNVLPAFAAWGASTGTNLGQTDLEVIGATMRAGPSSMPNLVPNGSLDDGGGSLNGFIQVTGNWYLGTDGGHNGPNYVFTNSSTTPPLKVLASDALGGVTLPQHPRPVAAAEEYELWMVTRTNPGFTDTDGEVYLATNLAGDVVDAQVIETPHALPDDGHSDWRLLWTSFSVPDGYSNTAPALAVVNQTLGQWDFDDITLIRRRGNIDVITSPSFPVTPGRPYLWRQNVRTNTGFIEGEVTRAIVCSVAGRPDVEIMGPAVNQTDGADQIQEWEFTVPSGFDTARARVYCQDVVGASVFLIEEGSSILQTDTSTWVADTISGPTTTGVLSLSSTAPAGAKDVHVELVAEAFGIGWVAGNLSLIRTTAMPVNGDILVSDLLAGTSVIPGYVTCPEFIPYDWRILNLTIRDALEHYCTVVSEPAREYRVNPTDPPTVNVATPEVLFIDHSPDSAFPITIVPADIDVQDLADPETDVTDRATLIRIIGAERPTVSGRPILITADAAVPGEVERDYNNNPIERMRIVSAGTVDHFGYAQALAADLAEREAEPALNLSLTLSGRDTRADLGVGDWIYVFHPEAGLQDTTYVDEVDGLTVFPRRVRVLARERNLGPSYYIVMRRPDGTTFPLPGVLWSDEDATVLTIGDRVPDWQSDPQGRTEGEQYLRDRKSGPR